MSIRLWFKSLWHKIDYPNVITRDGLKRSCPNDCEVCDYLLDKFYADESKDFPTAKVRNGRV